MFNFYRLYFTGNSTFAQVYLTGITVKNIRYFTNGVDTIEWNQEKCMHSGKCLKNIPYIIDKPGIYSINVSERQFDMILNQAGYCPAKALKIKDPK